MKIVVTVHTYWPKRDGVQYVTQYLCEGLVNRGHDVTVITTVPDKRLVSEEYHNKVRIVRAYLKTRYSLINFGVKEYLKTVMKEVENADTLINCCVQSPNNNVLLPYLKHLKIKKILYMHGMHEFRIPQGSHADIKYLAWHFVMNIRWWVFYHLNNKNFKQYDELIDIHKASSGMRFMKKMGVDAQQHIITNAVENFESVRISDSDLEKYPVLGESYFLNVANFNDRKNQRMLIEAYNKLPKKNNYKLVLIGGESDYSQNLKHMIKEYDLENEVYIYENQDRETTKKFIKNCICGVLSSRYEVYPIFLCEVICCGHPYISTDVGCVKDIPGGLIAGSVEEFVTRMEFMIQNKKDCAKLGLEGYKFAMENLSQINKIIQLENIISEKMDE